MPTYTFQCADCDFRWDRNVAITQRDQQECPRCHSDQVSRPVTGSQVVIPVQHRSTTTVRRSHTGGRLAGVNTSTLPVVGRDGKLYSADGKKVIKG